MRKLVYVVLFIGMVLGIVNLTLSNSLASEGEFLRSVSKQKDLKTQDISRLRKAIMEAQGLATIESRARDFGFVTHIKTTNLKTRFLAGPVE